jgi:glyoxylase-like metal-dependent hydrolase (beta-lactamase superfamily II)
MAIGDVYPVEDAGVTDCYYVDTGMFDTPEYTSVYVIDAERPAVVDTGIGTDHEVVLGALEELDIAPADLEVIAPTHVHLDHAGGAGFLAAACSNATVAVHEIGAPHLIDPSRLVEGTKRAVGDAWAHYADPEPVAAERVRELSDGDQLDLGDRVLDVHHAPGHAPHQAVFHDPADAIVFTADAAGIYVPTLDRVTPTTPPPNFDLEQCLEDVARIETLDPAVLAYSHFGPVAETDRLGEYATVLEDWVATVADARDRLADDEAVIEHLIEADDLHRAWGRERAAANVALNVRGVLHSFDRQKG